MNPLHGIALKIMSVALFTAMAACVKAAAGAGVPAGEAVFFRSALAIPVILTWLAMQHDFPHGLTTRNPMGHVWRGLVGAGAMASGFTALGLLPLPEVTAIGYAAPLLIVVFAAMFLNETVRLFRLTAVVIGLVGVTVVLSPRLSVTSLENATQYETLGATVALMGAVLAALAQVFVRKLVHQETTASIVFWFSVTTTVLSLFTIPFGWIMPDPLTLGLLVSAGLLGGVGQILLTSAYRFAPTSVVAPFEYTSMILAIVVGYAFFDETPTGRTLLGAALVVSAGLFIIWRERKLGLERGRARKAMTPQG
ncbi:EamA family transporter [Rhodobacteraceae bacterium 2CG4]|uniref:EamA family transporter n=1 Tax=Halovulum marinum TaxID=2662447 RepID=A0A6L5Z397_9RHOB|nr:DMT family transporter [Halovulum marinum]MSU91071.1 EamA family transporter [Halovulum marinum]